MALRAALVGGSPVTWLLRGTIALIVAVLCYGSATFSLAQHLIAADPALAYRLAPYDGSIAARYAASLSGPEANAVQRRRADGLARAALRREPTAVVALSTLGINAAMRGDEGAARRAFGYAERLSRRDLQTQLWAIEDAVQRGDVAASLRHYDIVLRVWPRMFDLLFPVLSSASGEPPVANALVTTLSDAPPWANGFIEFAATFGADARASGRLLTNLRAREVPISGRAQAAMIGSLIARADADATWTYYAGLYPRADRRRVRDPRFAARLETPSVLDWVPVNENGVVTSTQGMFEYSVPPSIGGPLLRQVQLLPPGSYVLTSDGSQVGQVADAPYWSLTCREGKELGRLPLAAVPQRGNRFSTRFVVPSSCPVQTLTLMAQPTDALAGLSGTISYVDLRPAA